MRFEATPLPGAFVIRPQRFADDRGHFQRTYDRALFIAQGLEPCGEQCSISFNLRAGTLRGMHFQEEPHGEAKLVRVSRGAMYDVIVDVRDGSPTRGKAFGVMLDAEEGLSLYIPRGFAHGFQTLQDNSEMCYAMSTPFVGEAARGYRPNDPAFAIDWPLPISVISPRDLAWSDFT